jgi:hypothetical protein
MRKRLPYTPVLNSNAVSNIQKLITSHLCETNCLVVQHLFEPRTEPALGLFCCLESLLVEFVDGGVDLLAGAGKLLLGLDLGLLILLASLDTVLVKLLLGLLCLGLCLVGLRAVSNANELNVSWRRTYC